LVDHTGAETHSTLGRGYTDGSSIGIKKGFSVSAKAGSTVFFYEDSAGKTQVGPSGGKGGQANPPSRSGTGEELEYVGVFSGNATNSFIQVDWVNQWWQDGSLFKKGTTKQESRTSWVKISSVTWSEIYVDPKKPVVAPELDPPQTGNGAAGIDSTTLGLLAVGGAFLLRKKKRK
jgi:LPXTG-motif cell wall-anchored protein